MDFHTLNTVHLESDVHVTPRDESKFKMHMFSSVLDRWNAVSLIGSAVWVTSWLKDHGYAPIASSMLFPGHWEYRLIDPDWPTLKEWLRVIYNERERKTEYKSVEEKVYQNIISMLLEDPPQSRGATYFDAQHCLFEAKNTVAGQLYEEFLEAIKEEEE